MGQLPFYAWAQVIAILGNVVEKSHLFTIRNVAEVGMRYVPICLIWFASIQASVDIRLNHFLDVASMS